MRTRNRVAHAMNAIEQVLREDLERFGPVAFQWAFARAEGWLMDQPRGQEKDVLATVQRIRELLQTIHEKERLERRA